MFSFSVAKECEVSSVVFIFLSYQVLTVYCIKCKQHLFKELQTLKSQCWKRLSKEMRSLLQAVLFSSQFSSVLEHKYSELGGGVLSLLWVSEWGWWW